MDQNEIDQHMLESIGLGWCMVGGRAHGQAHGVIGIEGTKHEPKMAMLCCRCIAAHTESQMLATILGAREAHGLLNQLIWDRAVTEDVALQMLEAALEGDLPADAAKPIRETIALIHQHQDKNVTPITANAFAELMARTNTTNPRAEEVD